MPTHRSPAQPSLELHYTPAQRVARAALNARVPTKLDAQVPTRIDGRELHPSIQRLLAFGRRIGADRRMDDVESMRRNLSRISRLGMPTADGVHTTNRQVPGPEGDISVRVYRPHGSITDQPAIMYLHGGGWVTGDIDSHDGVCRILSIDSGCTVVSVDYRLAPEHPFPAAYVDSVAVYEWLVTNGAQIGIDTARVGVAGDSAGGNLTAVVCQEVARRGLQRPAAQCLIYPAVDTTFATHSHRSVGTGFGLETETMTWFKDRYLPNHDDRRLVQAAPYLEPDLTGQPPAIVITAGFDPLRDEGEAYANRLAAAQVPVTYRCYDSFIHGFFGMGVLDDALAAIREICAAMGELMHE